MASLLATALFAQLVIGVTDNDLTIVRFFSYFTVLSNTMAVVMLTMLAIRPERDSGIRFATFRGAVTVYMSVTALIWAVVLLPNYVDVGVPEPWIDWSIHLIGPLFLIVDWILHRPPVALEPRVIGLWLVFPAAYATYTLIRGPIVDWYPYPFFDPGLQGGYGAVALGLLAVTAVIVAFAYACWWWSDRSEQQ